MHVCETMYLYTYHSAHVCTSFCVSVFLIKSIRMLIWRLFVLVCVLEVHALGVYQRVMSQQSYTGKTSSPPAWMHLQPQPVWTAARIPDKHPQHLMKDLGSTINQSFNNTGLSNEMQTNKDATVLRMSWEVSTKEERSCSVVWSRQQILLYCLTDVSKVSRLWLWVAPIESFGLCADNSPISFRHPVRYTNIAFLSFLNNVRRFIILYQSDLW